MTEYVITVEHDGEVQYVTDFVAPPPITLRPDPTRFVRYLNPDLTFALRLPTRELAEQRAEEFRGGFDPSAHIDIEPVET